MLLTFTDNRTNVQFLQFTNNVKTKSKTQPPFPKLRKPSRLRALIPERKRDIRPFLNSTQNLSSIFPFIGTLFRDHSGHVPLSSVPIFSLYFISSWIFPLCITEGNSRFLKLHARLLFPYSRGRNAKF